MRTKVLGWVLGVVGVVALVSVAGAQSSEPACSVGYRNFHSYGFAGLGTTAYTATAKSTFQQTLADGSHVGGYVRTRQARDGAGKTMSEMALDCRLDASGVPLPDLRVSVYDPATRTQLGWQVNGIYADQVARVYHLPPPKKLTPEELAAQRKRIEAEQPPRIPRSETKTEDLGMRSIAGVEAHGSRTTRTIPAGEEGNELPLVMVHEQWIAKDPGVVVMAIDDDPRYGRSSYEVEELTVGEPDPSLFLPPAGYKIVDPQAAADSVMRP